VKDPSKVRIEFRTIDATTNPYLGFAAMVLAGVDGIRRGLDPVSLVMAQLRTLQKVGENS